MTLQMPLQITLHDDSAGNSALAAERDADRACSNFVKCLMQVTHLTEEVAALEDENRRLSEVIQAESPHTEELLLHVKELQHVSAEEEVKVLDILCDLCVIANPAGSLR